MNEETCAACGRVLLAHKQEIALLRSEIKRLRRSLEDRWVGKGKEIRTTMG